MKSWTWIILLLLVVMGASSQFINEEPIYNDEYHSLRHTGLFETRYTISQSLNSVARTSPEHAPLYFLILNGWVSLVGLHPVTAAMLTLLFMMLAMSMVYRLGTTLVNAEVGVYATFFLSASAFVVFYAQEIRMYVPLIFVVAGLLYHYWTIINTKRVVRWWQWVGLYGFSVVSIYMHYFTIFVLLSIGLYHLLFASKTRIWLQIAVAEVLAGVTFLPWLPTVFAGLGEAQSENISRSIVQSFPELLFNVIFSQSNGLVPAVVVLSVASLLLYRRFAKSVRFMWVIFGVTFSLIYLMTTFTPLIPVRRIRYLLMIAPLMMIIWGMGLYYLSRWRWIARALMIGWIVMAFVFVQSDYMPLYSNRAHFRFDQYPLYHQIEPILAEFEGQHAPVVTVHPSVPVILIDSFYQQWLDRKFYHVIESQSDEALQAFTEILDDANAFWLVDQPMIQPIEDYAFYDAVFKDELHPCLTLADEANMRITYYLKQAISCELVATDTPFMLEFENGMQLKNSILQHVGDGQYRFDAWWFQNGVMDESVGFSLQVLDGDYNKYYQLDAVVQRQSIATYDIQLDDMPAGEYSVFVILYTSDGYDTIYGRALTASEFERMNAVATLTITD